MGALCYQISGGILLVLSIVFLSSFDAIFNAILEGVLKVKEDGKIYDAFISPPVDIHMQFIIFHVENADDVMFYGAKPKLVEKGPYVFAETREKYNVTFTEDDEKVNYYNMHRYKFDADRSVGKLSDEITTVNIVMATIARLAAGSDTLRNFLWPEIESQMSLLETHTAGEILFDGWQLPDLNFDFSSFGWLISDLDVTNGLNGTLYDILIALADNMNINDTEVLDFLQENRIGYMYGRNNAADGFYTVNTGKGDMDGYLETVNWEFRDKLSVWNDEYCDMLNGTDGSQIAPHVHKDDTIYIFSSDLCRSLYLRYEKEVEMFDTQKLWRFIPPEDMFQDHEQNPNNECYCWPDLDGCLGSGFINLEGCAHVPIIMSSPHFYQGDESEREKFEGLNPDKILHQTTMDVQSRTGLVMSAHKRIQLNVPFKKYDNLPTFKNIPEAIFPVLWLDEWADGTEDDINLLHGVLSIPFIVVYTVFSVTGLAGIGLLGYSIKKRRESRIA